MSSRTRTEPGWVRYNPRSAILLLLGVSPEAELAHRRLCDYVWGGAPWPAPDFAKTGELGRVPREAWERVLAELTSVGWRTRNGLLFHPDVDAIRAQAIAVYKSFQARSKAANAARWADSTAPNPCPAESPSRSPTRTPRKVSERYVENVNNAFNPDERLTLSSEAPKLGDDRENKFLETLQETLTRFSAKKADAELKNWGGWWRNRYRENPDKARRVLAEVACMVKERRIKRNPGAAGLDLWKRLP